VHRSLHTAEFVTAGCWVGAYLLGSVPFGFLLSRWSIRRDLRRLEGGGGRSLRSLARRGRDMPAPTAPIDLRGLLTGGVTDPAEAPPSVAEVVGALLDTVKVLGLAFGTFLIVRAVSPGFNRGDVPASSDIGVLADQVLVVWQSASLWAGLAAGVGHLWPPWLGFRGAGQGQVPLLALAVRFTPIGFVVAVVTFVVVAVASRSQRLAVGASLAGFVGWNGAAWLWSLPHWWGLLPGQELAIWTAVLGGAVAARTLGSRSRPAPWPAGGPPA